MTSTIKIKNSSTAGAVPGSGDLVQGELAVNVTDKKIYTKNASGTIVNLGTTPSITDNGNAEAIVIDSSENIGIGVSPSAWVSPALSVLEFPNGNNLYGSSASVFQMNANNYYDGATRYKVDGFASRYRQDNGKHIWYYAATGVANASFTFTQAMTLNASGYLGIGTTSPSSFLHVQTGSSSLPGAILRGAGDDQGWLKFGNQSGDYYSIKAGVDYSGMLFITGGSERARIDSSGNLLVGTTTATGKVTISGIGGSNGNSLYISSWGSGIGAAATWKAANTSNADVMYFETSAAQVGKISITSTATSYVTSSDYRLKENIAPMTGALAKIAALKPCTYTWKSNGEAGEGFIAHELQEVVPHAVTGEKDEVKEDGTPLYQGIDTSFLVATLTAAIQELKAEFDAYKATHP